MDIAKYRFFLADDDEDDCQFFMEAIEELAFSVQLQVFRNGVELMEHMIECSLEDLPDIIFLDLNMPLKSGHECLEEIKLDEKLKHLPVIIFSTSLHPDIVDRLYNNGATYYIRKPGDFSKLRQVINEAMVQSSQNLFRQPARENFILQA